MRLRLIALTSVALAVSYYASTFAIDFSVYYPIAKFMLPKGGPLYGEEVGLPWPMWYRYPPFFLFLVYPFSLPSFPTGAFLWTLPKCFVLYGLVRAQAARLGTLPNWWIVAAIAAPYVVMEFRYANVQFYVFALTAWALLLAVERPWRAAGILGVAIAIKIWPLFFVPYLAVRGQWRTAGGALCAAAALTLLPAAYLGWSANLELLAEWYAQESAIAATAGNIWFPSQSLFGVLTRYLSLINYSSMPDSGYWNLNVAALSAESVRVIWLGIALAGYLALLVAANRWRGALPQLHALAFCVLVLLQPFTQKQSALVVLILPALVAGCLPSRFTVAAAVLSIAQPVFATGYWQRTFQLLGLDALIVLLLLTGLALSRLPPPEQSLRKSASAGRSSLLVTQ